MRADLKHILAGYSLVYEFPRLYIYYLFSIAQSKSLFDASRIYLAETSSARSSLLRRAQTVEIHLPLVVIFVSNIIYCASSFRKSICRHEDYRIAQEH